MGNVVNFQVQGIKEMNARIAALQREFGSKSVPAGAWVMRALHDGARVVRDEAKRRAPVLREPDPRRIAGELRANIVEHASKDYWNTVLVRVRNRGYIFAKDDGTGRKKAKSPSLRGNPSYWWLVEFGTSKAPAQPFLRPAFESKKGEALNAIRNSLARGLDAIVAKLQQIRIAA